MYVHSLFGTVQVSRKYYASKQGGPGMSPADEELGLYHAHTPGLAKAVAHLSAQMPFEDAAEMLHGLTGAKLNARQCHRLMEPLGSDIKSWLAEQRPVDPWLTGHQGAAPAPNILYISYDGTGVPMRKEALRGRQGKTPDGPTTREVRVGCFFTQSGCDAEGKPVRDPGSCTYITSLKDVKGFGRQMRAEAQRRNYRKAPRLVILTDGAAWCKTLADQHFCSKRTVHIIDFYHAAEHLSGLAKAFWGDSPMATAKAKAWRAQLLHGDPGAILAELAPLLSKAKQPADAQREYQYFDKNRPRMQYGRFRQEGLFIGSGVVEAACRAVVGQRAKQSGMFWSVSGVSDILNLRCLVHSDRFEAFFKHLAEARIPA